MVGVLLLSTLLRTALHESVYLANQTPVLKRLQQNKYAQMLLIVLPGCIPINDWKTPKMFLLCKMCRNPQVLSVFSCHELEGKENISGECSYLVKLCAGKKPTAGQVAVSLVSALFPR